MSRHPGGKPRPGWRLLVALYPFGAGAAAVNLFFASLIFSWIGWRVMTPHEAVAGGLVLGLPATWAFARHIRGLMDKAEPRE
ncbi:NnrT protein [uncultured Roseibium sp.]|uniref:NnrT protein n=1 Tax=uncultured Roseibium sp. TaxID=1936171 RepID=UPI00263160FA|nr:NnrT protein [uncultured Roseibium sp.]